MTNDYWVKIKSWNEHNKKWFWGVLAAIIAAFIPLIVHFFPRSVEEPKFIIVKSILRSDAILVIKANNKIANQKKKLDIIFDGFSFPEAGISVAPDSNGMFQWNFKLINHTKVDRLIKDVEHKVKVSFPGGKSSDEFNILFVNDQPFVDGEIIKKDSNTKILKGKATTKTQIPENEIKVEVTFYHEDSTEEQVNIPVKKVEYQETGLIYFEFETQLKNFPEISPNDSRYSEIFFAFRVSDKAGNEYYYEESYGQYVTGGRKRFGALNVDFKVDRQYDVASDSLNSSFRVKPNQQLLGLSHKVAKKQPINLKVTSRIVNLQTVRRVDWTSNIPKSKSLAFVYRDGKKIGESETNSYTDTDELPKETAKYHVEIEDEFGKKYISSTEIFIKKFNIYVTHLTSFIDSPIPAEIRLFIDNSIIKGIKLAQKKDSSIKYNEPGHLIHDIKANVNKLNSILLDPNLTKQEKITKIINDMMKPNDVDVIVTGIYIDKDSEVDIRLTAILKHEKKVFTKFASFKKEFVLSPKTLCDETEKISKAATELLLKKLTDLIEHKQKPLNNNIYVAHLSFTDPTIATTSIINTKIGLLLNDSIINCIKLAQKKSDKSISIYKIQFQPIPL